jgi:hypothetical protein
MENRLRERIATGTRDGYLNWAVRLSYSKTFKKKIEKNGWGDGGDRVYWWGF